MDVEARSSGLLGAGERRLEVELRRLSGSLRGHRVRGSGTVQLEDDRLDVRGVELASGDNRIHLSGVVHRELELAFDVRAPALEDLWPELRGRLQGSGSVRGARTNPAIAVRLRGETLQYGEHAAALIDADVRLDPEDPAASALEIEASELKLAGQLVTQAKIDGTGTLQRHQVQARVMSPHGALDARVSGVFADGAWSASLASAELDVPRAGVWRLLEPARLDVSAQRVSASRACWARRL